MRRSSSIFIPVVACTLLAPACRKDDKPSCEPDSVEWGVSLVVGSGSRLNPNDEGDPLPTVVRVYQLRGELAAEGLDSETVWAAEKAEELGESFLSFDELTIAPEDRDLRTLPLTKDATHLLAAGLFRESVGNTWYTMYEIPKHHPDVVCAREPDTKIFPDPCFFVFLDRSEVRGGEAPPAGFVPEGIDCAPLGPPPKPEPKRKSWRQRRKEANDNLDDPLRSKEINEKTPETPELPKGPPRPKTPSKPKVPSQPERPNLPGKPDRG